ncbi:hypothetical protein MMC24_001082 [Lignoscripta atroalba]|nr:hypothetical protein [Lignoscripta atroalba]
MATGTSLYGVPRPKSSKTKEISSSTSLAFTSQLSSLLAQSRPTTTTSARARPSKSKSDIFTAHNKNTKKRAAADISSDGLSQIHKQDIGGVDSSTLHRSKRTMEEKARLYAAMKRGDYIPPGGPSNKDEHLTLVDFDRKWAEDEAAGRSANYDTSSDSDNDNDSEHEHPHSQKADELVTYEDEFGRLRHGTRASAAREARRQTAQSHAAADAAQFSARPAMPSNLIYGDTVQAAAFNPEEPLAAAMEEIARKRDRSVTPPEEVHYDATKEVRSKGVGFYQFSGDKAGRRREMEGLEGERRETERRRGEREGRKEGRRREVEERRRVIREKRGEKMAERFLDGLDGELLGS